MVDVDMGLCEKGMVRYKVTTPKAKTTYIISKTEDGFSRYSISSTEGVLPSKLSGYYTTPDIALEALLRHIKIMPMTKTARRDKTYKDNKAWKEKNLGSDLQSDDQHKV